MRKHVGNASVQRKHVLVASAARSIAEALEPRRLLAGITLAGLRAVVHAGVTANLTSGGAAELSITPAAKGSKVLTPAYTELDASPQISSQGSLAPFSTPGPTGLLPTAVRHAYGVDQIMFGSVQGNGAGQTIAIIDAYDYPTASTDLHAFDVAAGLPDPPSFTRVNQTGGSSLPGVDTSDPLGNDWEVEEALDVEWSHAVAPEANIVLVEANSPADSDLVSAAVGYARSAPGVVAVTMSFGENESSTETGTDSLFTTPAGHGGVTFLASTGDSGAPGYYPAYSPNVVAVGGTTLNTNSSGGYLSETGWSGSGGGASSYEPQPAYQSGVVTQSTTARTIPDVAFDSDPNTGVSIYDSYDFGTSDPWVTVGGTSVASPAWAGLIAVADQGRTSSGGTSLDGPSQTLPKLYSMAASNFHDITSGNNGYSAGPGYDLITGRGSPVANNLIPLLAAAGPFVTSASPTGIQSAAPTSVTFEFSAAMNTSSFAVATGVDSFTGPHSVNEISTITGYSWLNSTTLQVNFTATTAQGPYTMVIGPHILAAGGAAMDQNQNGVTGEIPGDEFTTTFNYDSTPLVVVSTSPVNGGIIEAPSTVLNVTFNQPIDPATVKTSNLSVSQGTVSAVNVLAGNTTVQYTISGLVYEGSLTASMAVGALNDANGNPLETAFSGTYAIDLVSAPLPVPFVQAKPPGSLIYTDPGVTGGIQFLGDTDSYTVTLNSNQTLSVTVTGAASLQPTVQVTDPNSNLLGSATANAAGKSVILNSLAVLNAGTYTITIGGADSTMGFYSVGATLNAAINADNYGGSADQTLATAQSIAGSFVSLGGGASRGAVSGAPLAGSSSLSDYYSFPLTAGNSITMALNATAAGSDSFSLMNSSGTVLATGSSGPSNVDSAVFNFIAPGAGTYYAQVSAASGATPYNLVVVTNAVFSLESHNSFATAQSLGTTQGALGYLSAGSASEDWYSINVTSAGNVLAFSTATPGEGSGQFGETLDSHLEIYDPNDNLVASGTKLTDGLNESINYQPLMTGTYRVRVVLQNSTSGEYILKAGNALQLDLPANVTEGQGVVTGTLSVSNAPTSNLTVNLTSSDPTRITVPASVLIAAGQTSVSVPLTVIDDNLLNGPEAITISAAGGAYFSTGETVTIHDNETAVLSVSLPASALKNSGTVTGTITSSAAPSANITVSLSSNLTSSLAVPATVILLAGHTTATFTATIVQNGMVTGTEAVTVSASVENWTTGSATINIIDTDNTIAVGLPASGWEGQTLTTDTITLGGTVSAALVVNLSSSNTLEMTVPATVTVPAGQSSTTFNVTLLNSGIRSGSHTATLTATATGFNSGSASIVIHDSNLDHLGFGTVAGPQTAGVAFGVTVTAYNIVNEVIAVYGGTGTLTAAGLAGMLPVSPSSVTFSSGVWSGSATLTQADPATQLTLSSGGVFVTSNSFVLQGGSVSSLSWSTVSTQSENVPFPVTVKATDAYGNTATSYNGSVSLSGLVGSTNYQDMLGSNSFTDMQSGMLAYGYYFTLSSNYLVTAVRSYYGTDVSIWDSSSNLIQAQPVTAAPGSWTLTPLATPLQLYAGTTYLLSDYSGSGTYYLRSGKPSKPSFASFGTSWYSFIDGWPVYSASGYYPAVDLNGVLGTVFTSAPITPTTATLTDGIWTGDITVTQTETGMHLHAVDGFNHTADSDTFNVVQSPVTLNGSAGNTSFYLELDSSAANLQVWQLPYLDGNTRPTTPTGLPTSTYPLSGLGGLLVSGSGAANVSLILDETNGMIQPAAGITFVGGTGASGDYTTLLLPTAGATVAVNSTTITAGSGTINYSNLSAITVDGSSGNDTLIQNAQPGAALLFNGGSGNDTLTINSGIFAFLANPGLTTTNLTLNDDSTVTMAAASSGGIQTLSFAAINIGSGSIAMLGNAASHANRSLLVTTGLSIAANGKLDLGSNDLLLHSGNLQTLNGELATGFNNGAWNGAGIASSAAAGDSSHLTAIGMLLNNNGLGSPIYSSAANSLGLFDGQSPAVTDILFKLTYYGDANLDGKIDGSDYANIDNGFLNRLTGWSNGNFNYDGAIDGSDYTLIDNAYNAQGVVLSAQMAVIAPLVAITGPQTSSIRSSVISSVELPAVIGVSKLLLQEELISSGSNPSVIAWLAKHVQKQHKSLKLSDLDDIIQDT